MRGAQKILVCPLAKQQDGQEGERKVSFQKNPSRHVASKYILMGLGCWGGVWSARPWLSLPNVPIGQFKFIHSLL